MDRAVARVKRDEPLVLRVVGRTGAEHPVGRSTGRAGQVGDAGVGRG